MYVRGTYVIKSEMIGDASDDVTCSEILEDRKQSKTMGGDRNKDRLCRFMSRSILSRPLARELARESVSLLCKYKENHFRRSFIV
jgi:hypothetical protein